MRIAIEGVMRLAAYSLFSIGCIASAQNVIPTRMDGQPLMYMKDGAVNGCGLRIIGGGQRANSETFDMFDVSINLYREAGAMVKLVAYSTTVAELKSSKGREPATTKVTSGWIKAEGSAATDPGQSTATPGSDQNSLLYRTSVDSAIAIFKANIESAPVTIGLRRQGVSTERVYYGKIAMSKEETEQHRACLSEMLR